MPYGNKYVPNKFYDPNEVEQYSTIQAYTSSGNSITIPSGASIVRGIYYMWDEGGFTGKGWMYDIEGGPTNMYPHFESNDDVAAYVANQGDLNAVFNHWAQEYTLEGWDKFYNAVGVGSGCMDVDHSTE